MFFWIGVEKLSPILTDSQLADIVNDVRPSSFVGLGSHPDESSSVFLVNYYCIFALFSVFIMFLLLSNVKLFFFIFFIVCDIMKMLILNGILFFIGRRKIDILWDRCWIGSCRCCQNSGR
jgi:hypothetical protein